MAIETSKQNKKSRAWNLIGMAGLTLVLFFLYRRIPVLIHWWTHRPLKDIGDFGWEQLQKNVMANYTLTFGIWTSVALAYVTKEMLPENAFGPNVSRWSALYFLYLFCYCLVMT